MQKLEVFGANKLKGQIKISGSKNASLPILAATLLTNKKVIIKNLPKDNYITKYRIYCLLNENKKEIAQLQYDLFKETGFQDEFFDNIFNFLIELPCRHYHNNF